MIKYYATFIILVFLYQGLQAQDKVKIKLGEGEYAELIAEIDKKFGDWKISTVEELLDSKEVEFRLKNQNEMMKAMTEDPVSHIKESKITKILAENTTHNIKMYYYAYDLGGPFTVGQEKMLGLWGKKMKIGDFGKKLYTHTLEGKTSIIAIKGKSITYGTHLFLMSMDRYIASNQVYILTFPQGKEEIARQINIEISGFDWNKDKFPDD